mmetsp:Transcript_19365/g.66782  ORF Transcript_19365/g.66782 Transcript_19365/m.66782 type:complete len:644 (+) Transcript_19365:77-2008(+)
MTVMDAPALPPGFEAEAWAELQAAVAGIFGAAAGALAREELYRSVEDLCLEGFAPRLYERVVGEVDRAAAAKVADLAALGQIEQGAFVSAVATKWREHQEQTQTMRSIFAYLDRSYAARRAGVLELWDAGLAALNRALRADAGAAGVLPRLVAGLRGVARNERSDQGTGAHLLDDAHACCSMLSALKLYDHELESFVVHDASESYADLGEHLEWSENAQPGGADAADDAVTFSTLVEDRREQIASACASHVLEATQPKLESALQQRLVAPYISRVWERGFEGLVDRLGAASTEDPAASKRGDEARTCLVGLFQLLSRAGLVEEATKLIRLHAKQRAQTALAGDSQPSDARRSDGGKAADSGPALKAYFATALEVVQSLTKAYATLHSLCEVFGGKQCLEALKGGVEETLNDELYASKFAESLAAHFHEQRLVDGNAMLFFKLSRAKDVFEAFYRKHLATRLLCTACDADAERSGVAALEQECGAAYVTKLEGMCKDVDSSRIIRDEYATATQRSNAAVDLVPTVLTTGYWPNYSMLALEFRPELLERKLHFEKHYAAKFQGRRLAWHHALERCVVRAKFLAARKDIDTSLTQALVLMCFDGVAAGNVVTVDTIQQKNAPRRRRGQAHFKVAGARQGQGAAEGL